MSDAMIIEGLHKLSLKLVNDMRFAEADVVDQAIARIMEIPKALQRMMHPSEDWDETLTLIAKGQYGPLND